MVNTTLNSTKGYVEWKQFSLLSRALNAENNVPSATCRSRLALGKVPSAPHCPGELQAAKSSQNPSSAVLVVLLWLLALNLAGSTGKAGEGDRVALCLLLLLPGFELNSPYSLAMIMPSLLIASCMMLLGLYILITLLN